MRVYVLHIGLTGDFEIFSTMEKAVAYQEAEGFLVSYIDVCIVDEVIS